MQRDQDAAPSRSDARSPWSAVGTHCPSPTRSGAASQGRERERGSEGAGGREFRGVYVGESTGSRPRIGWITRAERSDHPRGSSGSRARRGRIAPADRVDHSRGEVGSPPRTEWITRAERWITSASPVDHPRGEVGSRPRVQWMRPAETLDCPRADRLTEPRVEPAGCGAWTSKKRARVRGIRAKKPLPLLGKLWQHRRH